MMRDEGRPPEADDGWGAESCEPRATTVAAVAHDLNNVLSVMSACIEILDARSQICPEEISDLRLATAHAAELTAWLARAAQGTMTEPCGADLSGAVRARAGLLRRVLAGRGELHLDLDPRSGPVSLDEHALARLLMNLVLNARDALADSGRVEVRTRGPSVRSTRPGLAALTVHDTGHGMDRTTLKRAFEPRFTTKRSGSGLGLCSVRDLVTAAGGEVSAESHPGAGTTITCWLPAPAKGAVGR
ncbi:MAG: HAMP domain-containing histidine kinase [Myxococcales bacterium]|nr:HAMP domain-containing histidine kinase [Myxococcales bacterium]